MFLYNVTIIVENDIHDDVRKYIEARLFAQQHMAPVDLLEMVNAPHEGTTYCIQLRSADTAEIELFQRQHVAAIQQFANSAYAGKVLFFDSTMKYLKHR